MLEERIQDICSRMYWNDSVETFPKVCTDAEWSSKADMASSSLTKSGIGRASVQLVVDILTENMERIASTDQWAHHPETRKKIIQFSNDILRSRFHSTGMFFYDFLPFFRTKTKKNHIFKSIKLKILLNHTSLKSNVQSKSGRRVSRGQSQCWSAP
jgi:hypothetical protein